MTKSPLSRTHPTISKDWIAENNFPLTPDMIDAYSKVQAWWRCDHGHEYRVSIYSRVRSNGCKICNRSKHGEKTRLTKLKKSVSFAEANPLISLQWDKEKNLELTPDKVSVKSHVLVWWKCKAGHSWQSTPQRRTRGDGCPECGKDKRGEVVRAWRLKKTGISLADAYPELLTEWDYDRNSIVPDKVTPKSALKVHWVCKYGHQWQATIVNRTHAGSRCPLCYTQSSRIEIFLLCELRSVYDEVLWRKRFDGYECDIFIPELNLGIEVDGEFWHRERNHVEQRKSAAFGQLGIRLIRVRDSKLPATADNTISYDNGEPLIQTTIRLFKKINDFFPNEKLISYICASKQQNQIEYQSILARLPAPPSGNTLLDQFPLVAEEWDYQGNYPLSPDLFTSFSDQSVSWICKHGHSWKATIKNRTLRQSGCPHCHRASQSKNTRHRLVESHGSLAKINPPYLSQWDHDRNGDLTPNDVTICSNIKVWWICPTGHSYQQTLSDKKRGRGCPECFRQDRHIFIRKAKQNKGNTFLDKHPQIAERWDHERNGDEKPSDYAPKSNKVVWWLCNEGHSYKAPIRYQSNGASCPICHPREFASARLFKQRPDLLPQWDDIKNKGLSFDSVTSNQKVWWKCNEGHSYLQAIAEKVKGHGCPECAKLKRAETVRLRKLKRTGSLQDKYPELACEWHPTNNGTLKPNEISSGSHQIVWWRCKFGHNWQESPNRRTDKRQTSRCPICKKMSKG